MGVVSGLFAFTPIPQTPLEDRPPPPIGSYRRIQVARHLIDEGMARFESMDFNNKGEVIHFGVDRDELEELISTGEPFITSGCPECNRPFYNESPRGPIYNYPQRPDSRAVEAIRSETLLR
jgi:biotin synthase-related radical SAM superfamily protein